MALWLTTLACGGSALPATVPSPAAATPTTMSATPTTRPTATAVRPDSGWQSVRPGLEQRVLNLLDDDGRIGETIRIWRLAPDRFRLAVGYRPGEPQSLSAWQAETGALLTVNGGFFTETYAATGLVVADGERFGSSYGDFAGMLAVTPAGADLRWLEERPYDPAEPLLAALQSFPVLVKPGGRLGFPEEDGVGARRTVVARDRDGRWLFILTTRGQFSLHGLSGFLTESDLNLDIALNLDGGASSGLILADPPEQFLPFTPLPTVILVYDR